MYIEWGPAPDERSVDPMPGAAATATRADAPARPAPPRPTRMPAGVTLSEFWYEGEVLTHHDHPMPVIEGEWTLTGTLYICPGPCGLVQWAFPPEQGPETPFCPQHGFQLEPEAVTAVDADPVRGARQRVVQRVRAQIQAKRDAATAAVTTAVQTKVTATKTGLRADLDALKPYRPSLALAGAAFGVEALVAASAPAVASAGIAALVGSAGAVAAYVLVYIMERRNALAADPDRPFDGRRARRARERAADAGGATIAAATWLGIGAALGVDPTTTGGALAILLAGLLSWIGCRPYWERIADERTRLAKLARQRMLDELHEQALEEAARREAAAQAAQAALGTQDTTVEVVEPDEYDPTAQGTRFAATWESLSGMDNIPPGLRIDRTRVVIERTRHLSATIDGTVHHLGWEYVVVAQPGSMVARNGDGPSLLAEARGWLRAVLGVERGNLMIIDEPDGEANCYIVMISESESLITEKVGWEGPAGIRRDPDGTLRGHVGRDILGASIYKKLWTPGQPGGGGRYGHTGGGKSVGTQISLLNDLAAGIFPMLYDPKRLVDFADFVGVIPIGVTTEHRDVILASLHAEMVRRQDHLSSRTGKDRLGRKRVLSQRWDPATDGPPIRATFEEFHMEANDREFTAWLLQLVRLQRATALMTEIATQGGGLADMGDSVLRGLINLVCMEIYRMPDQQARLAGYEGNYQPSSLPRVPGYLVMAAEGVAPIPMRSAFVTREDEEGSIYDQLFGAPTEEYPQGVPLLTAPQLPQATIDTFAREGLMDLWRLGMGPGGVERLLADGEGPSALSMPRTVESRVEGQMKARDVILAMLARHKGTLSREVLTFSEDWKKAGWAKTPDPSTVGKAINSLITCPTPLAENVDIKGTSDLRSTSMVQLTDAGKAEAELHREKLYGSQQRTEADAERDQEIAAERELLAKAT